MAGPVQFAKNMLRRAKNVEREVKRAKRIAATAALRTAVTATPVDTGRARGGWDVGVGGPGSSGTVLDPSGTVAIGSGVAKISQVKGELPIYISNNIVYIGPLEHGSSAQAPRRGVS